MFQYLIPEVPPSNNKFIGRNVRWEYQEEKKRWAMLINAYCRPRPDAPLNKAVIKIKYLFPDGRRRDPDNYSGKMILDGLKAVGIIEDDSFNNITLVLEANYKQKPCGTVIEVIEDKSLKIGGCQNGKSNILV